MPDGVDATLVTAYTGAFGDKGTSYAINTNEPGRVVFSTTAPLDVGEGLTIVAGWRKGVVAPPTRTEKILRFIRSNTAVFLGAAGVLGLLAYYLAAWFMVGRDPRRGVIIPLYKAPEGISPAAARYLAKMGADNKAFAATIVDFAVRGAIKIKENRGDSYSLEVADLDVLSGWELEMAMALFKGSSKKSISVTQTKYENFEKALEILRDAMEKQFGDKYFSSNSDAIFVGVAITALVLIGVVLLSNDVEGAFAVILWLAIWSAGCFALAKKIIDGFKEMFGGGGVSCGQVFGQALTVLFAFPFFLAEAVAIYAVMEAVSPLAMVCVVSVIAVNFVFIRIMGAYTHKGRALMDKVEGLKLYLSVAEKDRLEALHSPERTPETFEKFLPYAIALDVENEWAGKFADVLAQASLPVSQGGEGYSPSWYSGDRFIGGRVGAIGGGFASGLGRSMTSAISSASTPPGSSSGDGGGWSSGGGGGGGGGSSGGGGGGGGGGGW